MARRNPADDCLFCAPDPCVCNVKKAPARAVRKTIQSAPVTPKVEPPKPSASSVVEQSAATRPQTGGLRAVRSLAQKIERPSVTRPALQDVEREDSLTSAIRTFAEVGLVEADELIRHRANLRMTDHDFGELLLKVRGT